MALRWLVRPNTYHDSVKLMRLSDSLAGLSGVARAAAVMATPLNIELLADDGLLPPDLTVSPNDLLVTVLARDEASADDALAELDELLIARKPDTQRDTEVFRTLEAVGGDVNLAVIAVPGPLAAVEAFAALRAGLHVFLFSDNVSLGDEVRLKEMAAERGLLLMGPDCGTAIIAGAGLGFANRVNRGPVGIVGASGTGIQQVCCLLDELGIGIAQAIGTGGRDLSAAVGGSMTVRSLRLLEEDPDVEIITVISKPGDTATMQRLREELETLSKPVVACLLGMSTMENGGTVHYAANLTDAVEMLASIGGVPAADVELPAIAGPGHASFRGYVYGLYTGGTLRDEATTILTARGVPNRLVDLGADEYTRGRAHPMIDPRLRASLLPDIGRHDDAGAILLDVVLGDLAHPDPAGALLPALQSLPSRFDLPVFAVLIGTRQDPQGLDTQRRLLEEAGVRVYTSNARAAEAACLAVGGQP